MKQRPKRTAIYARVSTREGLQHLENQIIECRRFIATNAPEWAEAVLHYEDEESGTRMDRPALRRMFYDAQVRTFDVLVVFRLDRLTREGPARTFTLIERLRNCGVELCSVTEPHFRTSGPFGDILLAIAASLRKRSTEPSGTASRPASIARGLTARC